VKPLLLLVLLAILAIIAFGVGFTIHWLFVVAIILALLWLISLFMGGIGGRTRSSRW
jgi:CRISPR/Cas system CMR-associated protein Cmr1 (group 7 of RAMP superfamily)